MSNTLVSSDHRIQHVSSVMQSFLKAIEYRDQKPSSVGLSPQMKWLSSNLEVGTDCRRLSNCGVSRRFCFEPLHGISLSSERCRSRR
jgi:hypothetical protein